MADTRRFSGRAAVVTGAASGIGAATVRRLSSEGARVLISDRDAVNGEALASQLAGSVFFKTDVSDAGQIQALIARAKELFGGLDILVNNAGVGGTGLPTPDLEPASWRQVMAVNIDAIFYACRAAIPLLRKHGGAIVNTASISGLAGDYNFTAYNASKAAVINYTRSLALDHARDGIRVNAVCPGLVDTALTAPLFKMPALYAAWRQSIPLGRAGRADEIANVICFLASDEASFMTGSIVVADGGATAGTGQPNINSLIASSQSA